MEDFEACLAHLRMSVIHRRAIRTTDTNLLERLFVEERRRLKIIPNAFGEKPVLGPGQLVHGEREGRRFTEPVPEMAVDHDKLVEVGQQRTVHYLNLLGALGRHPFAPSSEGCKALGSGPAPALQITELILLFLHEEVLGQIWIDLLSRDHRAILLAHDQVVGLELPRVR
jgi:hypothetical protein